MRLPSDHQRKIAALANATKRLKYYDGSRSKAQILCESSGFSSRECTFLVYFNTRPWDRGMKPDAVFPHLHGIESKDDRFKKSD